MTITNKKLLKNFKSILSSSVAAKEIVASEIEKVDEKYRKLAEAEKSDLTEQMKVLDDQIKLYSSLVQGNEPEQQEIPAEEKVVDTVFPENNAEEDEGPETDGAGFTEADNVAPEAEAEEAAEDTEDVHHNGEGDIVWPEDTDAVEEESDKDAEEDGDGWPEEPQEW